MQTPSLNDVESFVRDFAGINGGGMIAAYTRLDADLGITGDDGQALLEEAARRFGVTLATAHDGYRSAFLLGENEHLFHAEGLDLLGISALLRWLRKEPRPIVRDLTIGELHAAILRTTTLRGAV